MRTVARLHGRLVHAQRAGRCMHPTRPRGLPMPTSIAPLPLLASLLLGAGTLQAQGGGITYAPGTHRYLVSSTVTYEQEMSGRKSQVVDISTDQQVTVTLLPHAGDTLVYAIHLDSIDVSA